MGALAGGVLAGELCAPLLLLCWLCCWPDDNSDSSSSGHPKKPVVVNEGSRRWRRSSEKGEKGEARARVAGSAVSLHVPGTSGCVWGEEELGRYHSAPSVIREVLLRRDWDRSSRELHIPLHPPSPPGAPRPAPAPRASPDPSPPRCKKHHSNIKSSRAKEQRASDSERDQESPSTFYIGDAETERAEERPLCQGKEEKQCLNESLRSRERPWRLPPGAPLLPGDLGDLGVMGLLDGLDAPDGLDGLDGPDRSGAVHHALDSRAAAVGNARIAPLSPISVDVVGYEYEACACDAAPARLAALAGGAGAGGAGGGARARHASDGDILAPALRPESGAFSESDLDIELRLALQAEELQELDRRQGTAGGAGGSGGTPRAERRETAI